MGNSAPISVTVAAPPAQTYFFQFNIEPRSGNFPLTITVSGYLTRLNNSAENDLSNFDGNPAVLNGETIDIQIYGANGWQTSGVTAQTTFGPNTGQPYDTYGFFAASLTLLPEYMPSGTYQFRAYYAGNAGKALIGC